MAVSIWVLGRKQEEPTSGAFGHVPAVLWKNCAVWMVMMPPLGQEKDAVAGAVVKQVVFVAGTGVRQAQKAGTQP
jgi:hypothetical protein